MKRGSLRSEQVQEVVQFSKPATTISSRLIHSSVLSANPKSVASVFLQHQYSNASHMTGDSWNPASNNSGLTCCQSSVCTLTQFSTKIPLINTVSRKGSTISTLIAVFLLSSRMLWGWSQRRRSGHTFQQSLLLTARPNKVNYCQSHRIRRYSNMWSFWSMDIRHIHSIWKK